MRSLRQLASWVPTILASGWLMWQTSSCVAGDTLDRSGQRIESAGGAVAGASSKVGDIANSIPGTQPVGQVADIVAAVAAGVEKAGQRWSESVREVIQNENEGDGKRPFNLNQVLTVVAMFLGWDKYRDSKHSRGLWREKGGGIASK